MRAQEFLHAQPAQGAQHGGHRAVSAAAGDLEGGLQGGDGGTALQEDTHIFHQLSGAVSEIGHGALPDLPARAVGFAQEDAGGRVAVGNGFDIHVYIIVPVI